MIVKGVTKAQMWDAMHMLSRKHGAYSNIRFKREPECVGRRVRFTLTVKSTKGDYGKRNPITGRRTHALCWHGHAEFFKALWEVAPQAVIVSTRATHTDTSRETGFSDWQEGSMMYPYMASEACDCAA